MNIFIGNLSHQTQVDSLRQAFESHGQVSTANIIKDKFNGESKGFGFVEMPNKSEADTAIANLNGKDLDGRAITVSEARPRPENRGRGNGSRY
ncbi:MAG: RNA-binding protein [candidate division Zixibacteria bacterium RBG_16_53_22]|nr:MAG: RNA-binding protein [candidate division Zixibacteria bacterium RBG_16_53_22]